MTATQRIYGEILQNGARSNEMTITRIIRGSFFPLQNLIKLHISLVVKILSYLATPVTVSKESYYQKTFTSNCYWEGKQKLLSQKHRHYLFNQHPPLPDLFNQPSRHWPWGVGPPPTAPFEYQKSLGPVGTKALVRRLPSLTLT